MINWELMKENKLLEIKINKLIGNGSLENLEERAFLRVPLGLLEKVLETYETSEKTKNYILKIMLEILNESSCK